MGKTEVAGPSPGSVGLESVLGSNLVSASGQLGGAWAVMLHRPWPPARSSTPTVAPGVQADNTGHLLPPVPSLEPASAVCPQTLA